MFVVGPATTSIDFSLDSVAYAASGVDGAFDRGIMPIDASMPSLPVSRANSLDLPSSNSVAAAREENHNNCNNITNQATSTSSASLGNGLTDIVASRSITPVNVIDYGSASEVLSISGVMPASIPTTATQPTLQALECPDTIEFNQPLNFPSVTNNDDATRVGGSGGGGGAAVVGSVDSAGIQSPLKIHVSSLASSAVADFGSEHVSVGPMSRTESAAEGTALVTPAAAVGDIDIESSEKITRELGKALANFQQGENIDMVRESCWY